MSRRIRTRLLSVPFFVFLKLISSQSDTQNLANFSNQVCIKKFSKIKTLDYYRICLPYHKRNTKRCYVYEPMRLSLYRNGWGIGVGFSY
jgi:hypothetical protein